MQAKNDGNDFDPDDGDLLVMTELDDGNEVISTATHIQETGDGETQYQGTTAIDDEEHPGYLDENQQQDGNLDIFEEDNSNEHVGTVPSSIVNDEEDNMLILTAIETMAEHDRYPSQNDEDIPIPTEPSQHPNPVDSTQKRNAMWWREREVAIIVERLDSRINEKQKLALFTKTKSQAVADLRRYLNVPRNDRVTIQTQQRVWDHILSKLALKTMYENHACFREFIPWSSANEACRVEDGATQTQTGVEQGSQNDEACLNIKLHSGCQLIDKYLQWHEDVDLSSGLMIEIAGESGAGKTQLAMCLALHTMKQSTTTTSAEQQSHACSITFISSRRSFPSKRLVQLAEIHGIDSRRVVVEHVEHANELIQLLESEPFLVRLRLSQSKAIIVDSVTPLFIPFAEGSAAQQAEIRTQVAMALKQCAVKSRCYMIVINQVVDSPVIADPSLGLSSAVMASLLPIERCHLLTHGYHISIPNTDMNLSFQDSGNTDEHISNGSYLHSSTGVLGSSLHQRSVMIPALGATWSKHVNIRVIMMKQKPFHHHLFLNHRVLPSHDYEGIGKNEGVPQLQSVDEQDVHQVSSSESVVPFQFRTIHLLRSNVCFRAPRPPIPVYIHKCGVYGMIPNPGE